MSRNSFERSSAVYILLLDRCWFILKYCICVVGLWTIPKAEFVTANTPSGILEIRSAAPQCVRRRPDPPPLLPCHQNWSSHHHPRIQPKMERNVDAEVRKAQHMRVTRRRHHLVGAIPGRQCYASPLSFLRQATFSNRNWNTKLRDISNWNTNTTES